MATDLTQRWRDAEEHLSSFLEMTGPDLATMMLSSPPCHNLAQAACILVALQLSHNIASRETSEWTPVIDDAPPAESPTIPPQRN